MQGSAHLLFIQDFSNGHSLFDIHSGRQYGGFPIKPVKHEQDGIVSSTTRHSEFGPHGEGVQGDFVGRLSSVNKEFNIVMV